MEQYTSEQALNGIFHILNTVIQQHEENQRNQSSSSNQTGDLITELLGGVVAGQSKDLGIGQQVEQLSNGMKNLKDSGVTDSDVKLVAGMISQLGDAVANLELQKVNIDSLTALAQTLVVFGAINKETVDNINYLSSINAPGLQQVVSILNSISQLDGRSIQSLIKTIASFENVDKKAIVNIQRLSETLSGDVAEAISGFISGLQSTEEDIKTVQNTIQVLTILSAIDKDTINNLRQLKKLDPTIGTKLVDFLKSLDFSNIPAMDPKQVQKNIQSLSMFLNSVTRIIDTDLSFTKMITLPMRGKMFGKAIGKFFEALVDAIPQKEIKIRMNGIAQMLSTLLPLVENDSKYSIRRMHSIINAKTGAQIGQFFAEIINRIPDKKKINYNATAVITFLKAVAEFGITDFIKMRKLITPEAGNQIGLFFENIFSHMPDKVDPKALKSVTDFLKGLSAIGIAGTVTLMLLKTVVNEKFGASINGFVTKLVDGFDDERVKQIDSFAKSVKTLSKAVAILTGSIVLIAGAMVVLGVEIVAASMVAVAVFTAGVLMVMKKLGESKSDIEAGTKSLLNVAKAVTLLTLDLVIVAALAAFVDNVEWESLAKVGVIMLGLGAIVVAAMWASSKWEAGEKNIMNMVLGVSVMMVAATVAVGLATMIAAKYELGDIILGIAMVAGVVLGSLWLMNKMSEMNEKDIDSAVKNMVVLTGIFAAISLIVNFLIVPLGKVFEDALIGTALVMSVMGIMVYMTKKLSELNEDAMKQAAWNMLAMTAMFTIISVIALTILPQISEKLGAVTIGGVVVLGIVLIMTLMTKMLSKIDADNLKQSNNTLLVLTTMFVAISLIAAFLLEPIGQKWKEVAVGAIVVLAIIGLMVGMVALLNLIKKESLEATYKTLGVLTAMFVAVSLVAAFLLIPIGKQWDDVALGGVVVLGIIGIMIGLTWLTSLIGEDTLKQTYITLGVLTVMLVAVSLITKFILIPIGQEWEAAALGGTVVMSIIGIMTLLTWGLSKIDNDDLKKAWITLGVITIVLLGISLITKELLIPIGYEWDSAALGGVVVLAVIGIMGGMVAALGQMEKDTVLKGAGTLAAITAVLWAVSNIVYDLFIPIGEEWKSATKGGMVILGTISVMGLIIAALGKMNLATIAKGAAAVAAIGGVLWVLAQTMDPYLDLALKMQKDAKKIAIGGLEIVATLTVWGLIFAGVGLLIFGPQALVVAAGAAAIAGIAVVLDALALMLPPYIETAIMMAKYQRQVAKGSDAIIDTIEKFGLVIGKIGFISMLPFVSIGLLAGAGVVTAIAGVIYVLSKSLNPFIDLIAKMKQNNINQQTVKKFMQVMIGNGIEDEESVSLVNAIRKVTEAMSDIGVWTSMKAGVIAKNIRPIFETIGMFIDIVVQMCNLKYVDEWDEEGKPKSYKTITMAMFRDAASTISSQFSYFLQQLSIGLEAMSDVSLRAITLLSIGIKPVMDSVATFADTIIRICSQGVPTEWNKEGKPIKFRPFNAEDFKVAAGLITEAFFIFMDEANKKLKNVNIMSMLVLSSLKEGIEPVMNAVATYANTLMDLVAGKEVEYTDASGKTVKEVVKMDPVKFKEAATLISESFIGFIDSLYNAFKAQEYTEHNYTVESHTFKKDTIVDNAKKKNKITDLIAGLANIGEVLNATEFLVGMIMKTVKETEGVDLKTQANRLATTLTTFVSVLNASLASETMEEKLSQTESSLKKAKKAFEQFIGAYKILYETAQKYPVDGMTDTLSSMFDTFTFIDNVDRIKVMKSLSELKLEGLVDFSEDLEDVASSFKKVHSKIGEIDLSIDATNLVVALTILNTSEDFKNVTASQIRPVISYMGVVVEIAKKLKELARIMNSMDITDACQKFIRDIALLTDPSVATRASNSRTLLVDFGEDLKKFTRVVTLSQKQFIKYTKTIDKTREALKNLDDAILKKERERNRSLEKFAELIQDMADSVKNLKTEIEQLDENKILRNFQAIQQMLEEAKRAAENRSSENGSENQTEKGRSQNRSFIGRVADGVRNVVSPRDNRGTQESGSNIIPVALPPSGKTLVTFQFANTMFSGTMETQQI